jgi:hypothetical protein
LVEAAFSATLTKRAFLHEVRTFLAEPDSKERLENVRQLMETDQAGQEAGGEARAA